MWGSVLVLGLVIGLDPLRLAITLLVISRPRPVQNLLAYWAGCVTTFVPAVGVPLTLLHVTPAFRSFADNLAVSSTVRHIQLGVGVLALSIAAVMTLRFRARRRAYVPTTGGDAPTPQLDSSPPTVISRLLGRAQDAATEGGSPLRRLLGRFHNAWENGSLWVAFVIGIALGGVAPELLIFVLTIIVASGAAIGTQVGAAVAFVVGVLAVVELALVSYLIAPTKTEAVLRRLHDWASAHRQHVLIGIFAVGGVSLVVNGIGSI
ncbi:GAP family protein [Mycobacterium celatum]|uniref:GAP family protein n=1 Tax=Mycobacterium celatum TaxID=28045 RepID=A0A1X1RQE2_MYCCE|nr:GAP family protein [Mycobacterium celatum]ORV12518.1 gap protein [Mycobacterium celatum]PIB74605.1 GAP family protein [Mycobacterium celatum]